MIEKEEGGYTPLIFSLKKRLSTGSETVTPVTNRVSAYNYRWMRGFTTPNFQRKMRLGHLIPHTKFEQYVQHGTGGQVYDYKTSSYPSSGFREWFDPGQGGVATHYFGPNIGSCRTIIDESDSDPSYYVQAAASRLATAGFDASTFLAEFHKVVSMFMQVGSKLTSILKAKPPGTPWNLWLEYRYGWRQIIFDMKNLESALNDLDGARQLSTERAGGITTWSDNWVAVESPTTWVRTEVTDFSYSLSTRGCVAALIQVPRFQFNPLATGWEIVRFSFVIDWFLNVGQALGAFSFLMMQRSYTASFGHRLTVDKTVKATAVAKPGYVITAYELNCSSTTEYVRRIPTTVSFIPRFKLRLDVTKVLDLVALLMQFTLRR